MVGEGTLETEREKVINVAGIEDFFNEQITVFYVVSLKEKYERRRKEKKEKKRKEKKKKKKIKRKKERKKNR